MADADYAHYRSWKSWSQDNFYSLPEDDRVYFEKELGRCGVDTSKRISVFEIGFGNANFAKYCHGKGFSYAGNELDEELVARARNLKIDAFNSSQGISKIAGGRRFDLVAAFDVFEHIECRKLIGMLEDVRQVLSGDGKIIARFPSGDSPFTAPIFNGDLTHRTLIGLGKLDQICRGSGLKIVDVHAQTIPVFGLGARNAIRKIPVIAGRRLTAGLFSKLYFGNQKLVFDPNMVTVLEAEPARATIVRHPNARGVEFPGGESGAGGLVATAPQ